MTKNLRKAISNRSRLENRYYRGKSIESLRAYKKQKNCCSRLYKRERKRYYNNLDLTKITDSKKFWKTTKSFLSDKGAGINGIEGDEIFHEESDVANILSDFFSNTVKNLNVSIPDEYNVCCRPLAIIISKGITNSHFDNRLKLADWTPIHKADATTNKKNYRNVSVLPVVSKVLEKLMQTQICSYVENYLSPFLCGYRKGYSAQHALLSMLEKWRGFVDKGGYGAGVLMDLSKAFDTLDHDLLIAKLHPYGFSKNALRFIKSYLSDRRQRVKINASYSSWTSLLVGVPQGSVLEPLLFNLYINDLFYIIKTYICNYADDTTPFAADMSLDNGKTRMCCQECNGMVLL